MVEEEAVGNRMSSEEGAEVPRTSGRALREGGECRSEGAGGMGISVGGHWWSSGVGGCVEVEPRKKGSAAALGKVLRLVI
jgi:hypothetical protein